MDDEPAYRTEMRTDTHAAVEKAGVEPDLDEWAALKGMDWNQPDEQLQSRASRSG